MSFLPKNIMRTSNNQPNRRLLMVVLDPPAVLALAALVSATATLVWAIRRKP